MTRVDVRKTAKLFLNGAFVRSESGRTVPVETDGIAVNVARATRKDVRDAVRAARAALGPWSTKTAYNRGQIVYRLAEMMETRRLAFATGKAELDMSIDRVIWYAGWCDKIEQLLSTKNPVAGPHFNVSAPEPTGVVVVIAPQQPPLLGLMSTVVPPICAGNAVIAIVPPEHHRSVVALAECIATADVTPGALNLLTGDVAELTPHAARHMDVNALSVWSADPALLRDAQLHGADNVKRVDVHRLPASRWWFGAAAQDPQRLAAFMEIKTVWHPAGT